MHSAYGSGHATVAGACVTVLKAWFDESWVLPDPVASNIATGRNMAGVHWRTDYTEAVRLGEAVAIGVLRDQVRVGHESASFGLTRFDGPTA